MNRFRFTFAFVYFLALTSLTGAGAASAAVQGSVEHTVLTRVNLVRNDVWLAAKQLGFDAAKLRKLAGPDMAAVFDARLWPLENSQALDALAMHLNAQSLAAGNFVLLTRAQTNPADSATTAGYAPAEIGIVYAAAAYEALADPTAVGQELMKEILRREFSRLERGEGSVLLGVETRDLGVAFSGQQLVIEGKLYYTYVLTVIPARAQSISPVAAGEWLADGLYTGRPDLPVFDARHYLQANPDLLTAMGRDYQAARAHWLQFGIHEGRESSPAFDVQYYLKANPDLQAAFGDDYPTATAHWLLYGIYEGRPSSPSFQADTYLLNNPDILQAFGLDFQAAVWHYLSWGRFEGR